MAERTFEGRFTGVGSEAERAFVAARAQGLGVPAAAAEASVSRATGYRLARRLSERAAAAAPTIPTAGELAAAEVEREEQRKTLARARQRRYRQRAERVPERERRKRFDGAETREEWLIRGGREREQAREEPEKYVFRASAVKAGSVASRGYDHQDEEECAELALHLLCWGDVIALPQDLLERVLRDNDPYRYEQPLDLDVYAARYAQQVTR
jgi:hypothetical protein